MQGPKPHLGVGAIISSSLSILFSDFVKVILLGFAGSVVGLLVNGLFLGFGAAMGVADPDFTTGASAVFGSVFSSLSNIVIYGLVTALLIQLAYDARLGRSNSLGTYFKGALPAVVPIAVLSTVIGILSALGAIALIVGALWVYAVFYVTAPVAVIERGGFGSMGRSAELTKEYRWPIVGLFVIVGILVLVIQAVGGFVVTAIAGPSTAMTFVGGLLFSLIGAFGYAIGGIATALTYARLREIKEGIDVDQIASVFD